MKKIISIALVIVLFSVSNIFSSFAANIVGDAGNTGKPEDGVGEIPSGVESSHAIQVSVTDEAHRYAVDVTFPDMTLNFGSMMWNVNTLSYDITDDSADAYEFSIEITNHSDLPVVAYGSLSKASANDGIAFGCSNSISNKLTIPRVLPNSSLPNKSNISVTVSPEAGKSWQTVLSLISSESSVANGHEYAAGSVLIYIGMP